MKIISEWKKIINSAFDKSVLIKLVSSENVTVCKVNIDEKTNLQPHSHENEQISYVVSGEVLIKFGNKEKKLKAGDVCIIPSNVIHSAQILSYPFEAIDIFTPIRNDYLKSLE